MGTGRSVAGADWARVFNKEIVMSEMKWHPIETAPKDGTSVLVYGDGGVQLVAWLDNNTTPRGRRFME